MDIDKFLAKRGERRVVFFTGAGLSAESGIATFRDSEDGLWNNISIDKVCNISTFHINYEDVHKFYSERRIQLGTVQPNKGHELIAELQNIYGDRIFHVTSNVDDLIERAGGSALHVHGYLTEVVEDWGEDDWKVIDCGYTEYKPKIGCIAKPNVVMFGEAQRCDGDKKKSIYDEMYAVIDNLDANDIVVVIGSSDTVIPWSHILSASRCGASININLKKNKQSSPFDFDIIMPITQAVDSLKEKLEEHLNAD